MKTTLASFGIQSEIGEDTFTVYGGNVSAVGAVDSFGDHRIAMSSAILALNAKGDIKITGANAVNKSYPNFYLDFNKLGGKAIEIV
jgi:3-phosphoshikimate 1-carboxyvinyltransferase